MSLNIKYCTFFQLIGSWDRSFSAGRNISSKLAQVSLFPVLNCHGTAVHTVQLYCYLGGAGDGTVVRALASHQCGPGSIPGLGFICVLSLLLVLILAPRGFSLGTPVFPSLQKPTFLNSNLIWKVFPISALR